MDKIRFPQKLENLLKGTELFAPIRDYANRVGEILDDKQMPFFPSYTDHSAEHVTQVLQAEVDLIPAKVWELCKSNEPPQRLLRPEDAAVLIGGTLLHDIAMHLHPDGFLELVSENSRFQPLPWFKDEQQGHQADRPWRDLWLDYQREARRFSDGKLGEIIGMDEVRQGWKFETLPPSTGLWQENHRLVIGEFIRRHHARLAHEIAHYGFPGLETGHSIHQFPALAERNHPLENLADLIGLTARSHGMNLRTCQAYLESRYGKRGPRHRGCAVLYPMALLRVADYLQIDRRRTPAILLKLRNPQSPVSVQEWQKHLALLNIDEAHDPRGKSIEVSGQISHGVYLQLRELLDGLQKEMDHATAVLDEAYGRIDGLKELSLATRRVHSNLTEPAFRASLPYVPERTGLRHRPQSAHAAGRAFIRQGTRRRCARTDAKLGGRRAGVTCLVRKPREKGEGFGFARPRSRCANRLYPAGRRVVVSALHRQRHRHDRRHDPKLLPPRRSIVSAKPGMDERVCGR